MKQLAVFLLLTWSQWLQAQVFMRPFESAPALAAGGATVALPNFSAGLHNEALLGKAPRAGVLAGATLPYGLQGWQSALVQGYARINGRSGAGLDARINGTNAYQEQEIRLMYGRQLGQQIFLGASGRLLRVSQQEYGNANALTFNVSLLARALPQLWIGAQISNPLQQKLEGENLQSLLRIGACWEPGEQFMMSFETEKNIDQPAQVKAGISYFPAQVLALRAGMRTQPARMSMGLGLRLKGGVLIDAASEWHPALGVTPAVSVAWNKW